MDCPLFLIHTQLLNILKWFVTSQRLFFPTKSFQAREESFPLLYSPNSSSMVPFYDLCFLVELEWPNPLLPACWWGWVHPRIQYWRQSHFEVHKQRFLSFDDFFPFPGWSHDQFYRSQEAYVPIRYWEYLLSVCFDLFRGYGWFEHEGPWVVNWNLLSPGRAEKYSTEANSVQRVYARFFSLRDFCISIALTTMNRKILFASLFEIAVMVLCCMLQYILFRNFIYTKYGQR